MVVSEVIIAFICCLLIVTCENVLNQVQTVPVANLTNAAAEGGPIALPVNDTTHMGREHMTHVNHTAPTTNSTVNSTNEHMLTTNTGNKIKIPEYEVGQKNDNKTSVPKKDAVLSKSPVHIISTSTTTTTTTTRTTTTTISEPHKPTMTLGEDDEPPKPKTQSNQTQKHGLSIEAVIEKTKKTDYVVPIVAVILSVPLVAIVFSILYKRGSDWWQHRHYRRMDFLIEGMYNN